MYINNATVSLPLAELDRLRTDIKCYKETYLQLIDAINLAVKFDTKEFNQALDAIDRDSSIQTEEQMEIAVKAAESKIVIRVDADKLKAILIQYCGDLDISDVANKSAVQLEVIGGEILCGQSS